MHVQSRNATCLILSEADLITSCVRDAQVALADMRMTEEDLAQILLLRLPKGEKPGVARRLAAVSIERFGELPDGRVTNMMDAVKVHPRLFLYHVIWIHCIKTMGF